MIKKKYLLLSIGYLGSFFLAQTFFLHGFEAIKMNPGFLFMVTSLGIPTGLAKFMLFFVGIIDWLVVGALFYYRNFWVFAYAGIWPMVPAAISFSLYGYFPLSYNLMLIAISCASYFCFSKNNNLNSFDSEVNHGS